MKRNRSMTEVEILADVISAKKGDLPPDVARSMLKWKFSTKAIAKITRLATKNNQGRLTEQGREELDRFLRVGSLVNIAQAKARLSLRDLEND